MFSLDTCKEEGFKSHYKLVPLLNRKDSFDIYYP